MQMALVVDCHTHFIPPTLVDALRDGAFEGMSVEQDDDDCLRFHVPGLPPTPRVPGTICDPHAWRSRAEEAGIDRFLLAPWTDLLGYTQKRDASAAWTERLNQALGEVAASDERFEALGSVSLQHPDLAAQQLGRLREQGCRGAMIGTRTPSMELDDPQLEVVWQAASDLQLPLVVHPIFFAEDLAADHRLSAYGLKNAVGRANETTLAISRLLYRGVMSAHDNLRLVVSHGGGSLPMLLPRLRRNREVFEPGVADPEVEFARLYFDSVVLEPRLLEHLVSIVGHEQVLLGSDHPFPWETAPRRVVEEANLPAEHRSAILGANATELFALEVGAESPAVASSSNEHGG